MQSDSNILQVNNLSKFFGGLAAVSNCSLKIKKGSITGIIGPNGSGKTTLVDIISGLLQIEKGEILIDDQNVTEKMQNLTNKNWRIEVIDDDKEFTSVTEKNEIKKEDKKNKIKENIIVKSIFDEFPGSEILEIKSLNDNKEE